MYNRQCQLTDGPQAGIWKPEHIGVSLRVRELKGRGSAVASLQLLLA